MIKKICKAKYCNNYCDYTIGYCDEHIHLIKAYERQRKAQADKRRGTSAERGYNNEWRKARDIHLANEPLCRECLKSNVFTPANVVDHVISHKGDMKLFWDKDNWQSLCKECHDRKTVKEDGGFGNKVKMV